MEIKRFFANAKDLSNGFITIKGDEFFHMKNVLRLKVNYKIIVSFNDGYDYHCTIQTIDKNSAICAVNKIVENECKTNIPISLFQSIPKNNKLDLIVQKAVELGVEKITLFSSDYSDKVEINYKRINEIAIQSCKQCGRSRVCKINDELAFEEAIKTASLNNDIVIFAYENEKGRSLYDFEREIKKAKSIAIVVGSEGGFSPSEIEIAKKFDNVKIVSLGKRILRCETASIVAIGLVSYIAGDMNIK